MSPWYISIIM